eukprot:TRINITY_DN6227_c0_g2_i1.p1 TRINITY_DN6227_c0_g2~~TRINITY_DN6227_c0_g2_i1.p1  ORF type:complete len:527 (+),score=160.64 TRINITY_DN6227_c0_g2_i1:129-1709(+)
MNKKTQIFLILCLLLGALLLEVAEARREHDEGKKKHKSKKVTPKKRRRNREKLAKKVSKGRTNKFNIDKFIDQSNHGPIMAYIYDKHDHRTFPEDVKEMMKIIQRRLEVFYEDIRFTKIDAHKNRDWVEEHGLKKFPSIALFSNGKVSHLENLDSEDNVVAWVKSQLKVSIAPIRDTEYLNEIEELTEYAVIFGGQETDPEFMNYRSAAERLHALDFYITEDSSAFHQEFDQEPGVKACLYRRLNSHCYPIKQISDVGVLAELHDIKYGQIHNLTHAFKDSLQLGDPVLVLLVDKKAKDEKTMKALEEFKKAHASLNQPIYFAISYISKIRSRRLSYFSITKEDLPHVFLMENHISKQIRYRLDGAISVSQIHAFYDNWKHKLLSPYYRSEEPPKDDKNLVRKVVGSRFHEFVRDKEAAVLILLYAQKNATKPCRFCTAFEQAAGLVQDRHRDKKIVFGKMNTELNELADIDVSDVPGVLYFPANRKEESQHVGTPLDSTRVSEIEEYLHEQLEDPNILEFAHSEL